jgi:IS1 family transposase
LCRDTGELIAWECGDRDKATLEKLVQRLEKWSVKVYYTDDWKVYPSVISRDKLVQTKKETQGIERNNCRMRHWFARFKRKSIIVSKSVEMVNVTVALFARFRVNGDVFDILKIGQIEPNIII